MNEVFKLLPGVDIDLLSDMERIVGRIKDGTLSTQQATAEVKALGARLPAAPVKGRGRPVGARTKGDTPAVKRAREFIRLKVEDGLRPAQAAKRVAAKFDVAESTVYKDARFHDARLADEARLERYDILHSAGLMCLEQYPGASDDILTAYSDGLEKLALAVEALGNPVGARHVRSYAPQWKRWAIITVGMNFLSLLRRNRVTAD